MRPSFVLVLLFSSPAAADVATVQALADNTVYSESGTVSNGSGQHVFCGRDSAGNVRRALFRFDVVNYVPPHATIQGATLLLHLSQQNGGAETVTVHRALEQWGEGASDAPGSENSGAPAEPDDATWTERYFNMPLPWDFPGGDFGPAIASTVVDGVGDWSFSSSELTAAVRAAHDEPYYDAGFFVLGNETALTTARRFDSRENPDSAVRPRLVVTYTPICVPPSTYCISAPNSAGPGALMSSSGTTSISTNDLVLLVSGATASSSGLFYFGPSSAQIPFGDGWRCIGPPYRRLGVQTTSASGTAQRALDLATPPANVIGTFTEWQFQFLYRDVAAGGAGFNLSNALSVVFCP